MPELPEVETIARQLAPLAVGCVARTLQVVDRARLPVERPGRVRGREVLTVRRIGKRIAIELAPRGRGGALHLVVHLRMTGRLLWRTPGVEEAHVRARLATDSGVLVFADPRRLGTLELTDSLVPDCAIDPTTPAFTTAALAALLDRSPTPIKPWLMRQDRLVGLGNIYASEILFRAAIDPRRAAGDLDSAEIATLAGATSSVLTDAIAHCGTTFSDFQDAYGLTGSYQQHLSVYGREGEPCRRCATAVRRTVQAQRSTYWCPRCQR